jgi:hypothetical protein
MTLRQVEYTDETGRKFMTLIPDSAPDSDAYRGMLIGPPILVFSDMPEHTAVRLHNELFNLRILTPGDARMRLNDVINALMIAFRADAVEVVRQFSEPIPELPLEVDSAP